mmetsp:Transcript_74589/g.210972  ORF Transcript_74589/g.210972 Transcript_74589/m.210972 type:complete len:152 (-) Transcript_74589:56-511(-)
MGQNEACCMKAGESGEPVGTVTTCKVMDDRAANEARLRLELEGAGAPPGPSERQEPDAVRPGETFKVLLRGAPGSVLGIDINHGDKRTMVIESVNFAEGLVNSWNEQNPDQMVKAGDTVVMVNAISGDASRMVRECRSARVLDMVVRRGGC